MFDIGIRDGMVKVASGRWPFIVAGGLGAGLGTFGGLMMHKNIRKGVGEDIRDPRFYSNLRGMLTGESREKRVKAHKKLKRGKHTVRSAASEGWKRGGK
jgi:hypothetical protein